MTAALVPLQTITVDGWSCYDGNNSNTPPDPDGNLWIWQEIKGWYGELDVRENPIDRPMLDGSYDGPTTFDGRSIEISGTVVAPSRQALQRGMDALSRVLAAQTRRAQMVVDEAVSPIQRSMVVRLNGPTMLKRVGPTAAEWSISLYSPDPLRYSTELFNNTIKPYREGGGRVYDLTFPRTYGAGGSDGKGRAYNPGTAATAPLVVFNGPVSGPMLRIVGGDWVAIQPDLSVLEGERIEVDCANRTVIYYASGGPVNRRNKMTSDSRWLSFPAGYTDLLYTVAAGTGACQVSWRGAWT